ncbi:hypothetical protein FACS1894151_05970 [Spirochaetia bacterium]|nr:hypothetical protein FACS1894151_05970 [Spirochaetia bacterium]
MMGKARNFLLLFILLIPASLFSQTQNARPYWYLLERGKNYFRSGSYGEALIAFEDARDERRTMFTRLEDTMIQLLSMPEVRLCGDALDLVERYIADHGRTDAARALDELYTRVNRSKLANSAKAALAEFGRLGAYPEAEFWIGETYCAEGELLIGLKQYQIAYEMRSLLDTPGFEIEILYKIADIHRIRQEYQEMIRVLEEILKSDSLWSQSENSFLRSAQSKTLENDGINRFLTLYRYSNAQTEKAHRLLGFYYYATGRHYEAVPHLQFAFLIQNSIFIEELIRRRYDYQFVSLDELISEINRQQQLVPYLEQFDYYKTIYYLGNSFLGSGKSIPARRFWNMLALHPEAGEWYARSRSQLNARNPITDPPLENP